MTAYSSAEIPAVFFSVFRDVTQTRHQIGGQFIPSHVSNREKVRADNFIWDLIIRYRVELQQRSDKMSSIVLWKDNDELVPEFSIVVKALQDPGSLRKGKKNGQ